MTKHSHFPRISERTKRAFAMARNRGEIANKWFAEGNVLTPETKQEFDRLMKQGDKDFKSKEEK